MTIQSQVLDTETKVPQGNTNTQELNNTKEPQNASATPVETPNDVNWRNFRQEREKERKAKIESDRARQEAEEKAAAYKAAMESLVGSAKPVEQASYQSDEETEEQRIQKQVDAAFAKKERDYESRRIAKEASELPNNLTKAFSDFNTVCTSENLDWLEFNYPEVVAGYKNQPESFDKWANIYKAAKRFIPNPDSKRDQNKIEKNLNKPQSMSAPGATSTGDHAPQQLTESRRADNWARMQRTLKGTR